MPHNIFASRFFNNSRTPAWHSIGTNAEIDMNAADALTKLGDYVVTLQTLFAAHPADSRKRIESEYKSVVRHPVPEDPEYRVFGKPVSGNYHLITPMRSAQLFDEGVGNIASLLPYPIETFGVLGKGEELFMTCKLDSWDIKGDEMQNYMYAYFPMYSGKAAVIGVTTIRIVCANTLNAALRNSTRQFSITHTKGCESIIRDNIISLTAGLSEYQGNLKQALNTMADATINDGDALLALEYVYRNPPKPQEDWVGKFGHQKTFDSYMEGYETKLQEQAATREIVHALFAGESFTNNATNPKKVKSSTSTIAGIASVEGTTFGLYNAISEYESHRVGISQYAVTNLINGDRALAIRRGYETAIHYAQHGTILQYEPSAN